MLRNRPIIPERVMKELIENDPDFMKERRSFLEEHEALHKQGLTKRFVFRDGIWKKAIVKIGVL